MEQVNLGHSIKDIPIAAQKVIVSMILNSIESFTNNIGWRVHHFLNPGNKDKKEKYGFKTLNKPPKASVVALEPFKADLVTMIKEIEFDLALNVYKL